MTPQEIELLRGSWSKVTPIADAAAKMFYQRLFEIDPSTGPLFSRTDMSRQRRMLVEALGLVVDNAGAIETILPALEDLGRRHARYGVEARHYDSVGAAFIWTLEQGLGDAFTDAVRNAWTTAYGLIAGVMQRAANEELRTNGPPGQQFA